MVCDLDFSTSRLATYPHIAILSHILITKYYFEQQSGERDRIGTLDTSKLLGAPVKVPVSENERGEGRSIPIKQVCLCIVGV